MSEITQTILNLEKISNYLEKIKKRISPITILGLSDVSKASIISSTFKEEKRQILIVTYNELQAQNLHKNLKNLIQNVVYIPRKDIVTYAYDAQSMDILYSRIEGIIGLFNNEVEIIVISTETLMQPILSKKIMQNSILKIMVANEYNIEEIKEKLVCLGYERQDLVEGKGTFSVRGDILDIAISSKKGIRIEFFGDEVDQIRYFEISTQRSTENVNQIKIFPVSEEIEKEPKGTIIEYLNENCILAFDELNKIILRGESILKDNNLAIKDLVEKKKDIPYMLENMYDIDQMLKEAEKFQTVKLESQDIMSEKENVITLSHEEVKSIEDEFFYVTKQEKETKAYKPRKKHSLEFREAEKVTFSDLRVRRLCCT